jgi:cytochrome oxidase Cu insertion factor (SCO1/SenC/PrrC family)
MTPLGRRSRLNCLSRLSRGCIAAVCAVWVTVAGAGSLPDGLVDTNDHVFSVADLRSRWTLLTFGFSHCGSTCPSTLAEAHRFLANADNGDSGDRNAPAVRVIFVTLDPLSDDPHTLRRYLDQFDARVTGVTGNPAAIDALARSLRVGVTREGGTIEHSAQWYLISPELHVVAVYPAATTGPALALDVSGVRAARSHGVQFAAQATHEASRGATSAR